MLIDASVAEYQAGVASSSVRKARSAVDRVEQLGEGRLWEGGDLDLSAGFDRERRTGRERELGTVFYQRAGSVGTERGGQTRRVERPPGIVLVVDDPLELDAVQFRRSVLEADGRDICLSLDTVPQPAPVRAP